MRRGDFFIINVMFQEDEKKRWTAECLEFGTATFGNTLKQAKERINEAIELHVNSLDEVGELERFITRHKIKVFRKTPRRIYFDIPFEEGAFIQPQTHAIH